jgi:outer membrane protein
MLTKKPFLTLVHGISLMMVFLAASAIAEEQKVYTLESSIAEAFAKNWRFKAKKERVVQATHAKKQARAEFFPKLSASYGYTRLDDVETTPPTVIAMPGLGTLTLPGQELNAKNNYRLSLSVTQPVFTGFALISSYELAKLGIDQSAMEVELEKLDLALKVKEAYFNILIADKGVEVARKEVESLESNVKVASNFYKVGMIPINDLLKAEVELANARQNLVRTINAAKLARAGFNTVLSRPVNAGAEVKDVLYYKPEKLDLEKYLEDARKGRPEIKLLDIAIRQADQQIRLARSKLYPEVSLKYEFIKEGDEPDVSGSPFHDDKRWEATAVVTWTFWEWGKTHYAVKEKQALRRELVLTRKSTEDNVKLEVTDALLSLKTAAKNIPTTQKAVEQGEENLRVNEERYKAQVTTITEVLDAQTLLTRARVNYYRAFYAHKLAKAKLLRAIGTY